MKRIANVNAESAEDKPKVAQNAGSDEEDERLKEYERERYTYTEDKGDPSKI